MTRTRRRAVVGSVLVVALAAVAAAATMSGSPTAAPKGANGMAAPFAKRMMQATPGSTQFGVPSSWEEEDAAARAYPAQDIAYSWLTSARAGWGDLKGRAFPKGKGRKGTWTSVGPDTALYPQEEMRDRFTYTPAPYLAGSRMPAIAMPGACVPGHCRLYVATAGGGVWRTDNALAGTPKWTWLSKGWAHQATGSITIDPTNPNVVYAGTGEGNAGASVAAGIGIYKSTDAGNSWTLLGASAFGGRAVGSIAVDPRNPDVVYAASARASRGISSTTPGAISLHPGAPQWGLYKSTDGGATWTFIHNGGATAAQCTMSSNGADGCSVRGVRRVTLDPNNPDVVYASSFSTGVWRSSDGGSTWAQIFAPIAPAAAVSFTERAEIAVADLGSTTRMYLQIGSSATGPAPFASRFFVTDDAAGAAAFVEKSSTNVADPGWGVFNLCSGQCWYDQIVYSPPGKPNMVYVGGIFKYGEQTANYRAVVMSEDGGNTWYDMTEDVTDDLHPNQLHPDQHGIVVNPSNPYQFFEVSDGGLVRSSGDLVDRSAVCATRGLSPASRARCEQMLSKVPSKLEGINKGITSLQFFTLTANPRNPQHIQGGTQDNGTWESTGNPTRWTNINISDGGHNGFDIADPSFRFTMWWSSQLLVNFDNANYSDWIWVSDPFFTEASPFYPDAIADPRVSKTIFVGTTSVWRTQTAGLGSRPLADMKEHCNVWTGDGAGGCGDFARIGQGAPGSAAFGTTKPGGTVSAVARSAADTGTLWVGTQFGRVLVAKNADDATPGAVTFTRIDTPATPGRFVSSIHADPTNANRAWVSYSGYDASSAADPDGHVFEVVYSPATGTATWTRMDTGLPDTPVTDVAYDSVTGDLYASTDFGVSILAAGSGTWVEAAEGMPTLVVSSLTIIPGERILYAATHGAGAWRLNLPK